MTDVVRLLARTICEADPLAPDPDAPILYRMKPTVAWQARVPIAEAQVKALTDAGYEIVPRKILHVLKETVK